MIIDVSYFTQGPLHIQNASNGRIPSPEQEAVNAAIKAYIKHWQAKFLSHVVSKEYAKELEEYIVKVDNSRTDSHPGEDVVIEHLREPFANYVFYKILRYSNDQATMAGTVRLKSANEIVTPMRLQVSAWNEMVDMIRDFRVWAKSEGRESILSDKCNLTTKINMLNL